MFLYHYSAILSLKQKIVSTDKGCHSVYLFKSNEHLICQARGEPLDLLCNPQGRTACGVPHNFSISAHNNEHCFLISHFLIPLILLSDATQSQNLWKWHIALALNISPCKRYLCDCQHNRTKHLQYSLDHQKSHRFASLL